MQYRADEKIRFFSSLLENFTFVLKRCLNFVMRGLVRGIHVLAAKKDVKAGS
jgi:hypothetical protein